MKSQVVPFKPCMNLCVIREFESSVQASYKGPRNITTGHFHYYRIDQLIITIAFPASRKPGLLVLPENQNTYLVVQSRPRPMDGRLDVVTASEVFPLIHIRTRFKILS